MSDATFKNEFPAVDYAAWRALVEADLKGESFERKLVTKTVEGIDVQPLYTCRDAAGAAAFVREANPLDAPKTGCDLRQEHAHPDLAATNQAIHDDLDGGVTALQLRLDSAGHDADDEYTPRATVTDGILAYDVADLEVALRGVDLTKVDVALDTGAAFLPAAATLAVLWKRRDGGSPQGAFRADPLGALAREGELPYSVADGLRMMAELAAWTSRHLPRVTAVCVNATPYYDAGASDVQDLAFALATGVEYLRALTAGGLEIDAAARQMTFEFSLGTRHFLSIAKLRAARTLWRRVVEACGGTAPANGMRVHAQMSERLLTTRDPHLNLLRNTIGAFAAVLGGANSFTSRPFDAPLGVPGAFSRRLARNTLLILRDESHQQRVDDPPGGSWFIERYTQELADQAWGVFQEIERRGGMVAALTSGWIATQVDATFGERVNQLARGEDFVVGLNEPLNTVDESHERPALDVQLLRRSAAERIAQRRREFNVTLPRVGNVVESLVSAAERGATVGQMARALKFGKDRVRIAPFRVRRAEDYLQRSPRATD